jgi:hypothetical protein
MAPRPIPLCDDHADAGLRLLRQAFPDRSLEIAELASLPAVCAVCDRPADKAVAASEETWTRLADVPI